MFILRISDIRACGWHKIIGQSDGDGSLMLVGGLSYRCRLLSHSPDANGGASALLRG